MRGLDIAIVIILEVKEELRLTSDIEDMIPLLV
jgi:hypothetical protein